MPLRIEPLPRMAGHLPFMRGRLARLDDVGPGMVAAFGLPSGVDGRTDLAPLAMRETSAYFGSHFNANMKSAMDIDQRQVLRSADVAGLMVDLGDLRPDPATGTFEGMIRRTIAHIREKDAIPLLLGGEQGCLSSVLAGLRMSEPPSRGIAALIVSAATEIPVLQANDVACVVSASPEGPGDPATMSLTIRDLRQRFESYVESILRRMGHKPVHVALDASAIASHWHGASTKADFAGLSLSECRQLFRQLGVANIASMSITGLDPTINGLSLVKTGQRLLLTAILDLIYARLGVLEARVETPDVCA
jgi:agmatinase